jgi:hypothetical protein
LMLKSLRLSAFREQWETIAEKALHDQCVMVKFLWTLFRPHLVIVFFSLPE